ncbi:hypothetical protein FQN55_002076 [Onygenales sp. PD_40]|nr:hypothetical protein FQN55_002076 [Onygenales sp. PD_40]
MDLSTLTLSAALLLAACLAILCFRQPNPSPPQTLKGDRIGMFVGLLSLIGCYTVFPLALYHILLVIYFPSLQPGSEICPHPTNLTPALFTWSKETTASILLIVFIGAPLRLSAYRGLGKDFTFKISTPDRLVTSGVYSYIQHPSYTGLLVVKYAAMLCFLRWDGVPACWMREGFMERWAGWVPVFWCADVFVTFGHLGLRMQDEEGMLRGRFGREWEVWHARTKRLVPGVF